MNLENVYGRFVLKNIHSRKNNRKFAWKEKPVCDKLCSLSIRSENGTESGNLSIKSEDSGCLVVLWSVKLQLFLGKLT